MFIISNLLLAVAKILDILLSLYFWVIVVRAILSWVNVDPYNPVVKFLNSITEPVLYPIRRRMPDNIGGIDFSPLVIILAIVFLQIAIVRSLTELALLLG